MWILGGLERYFDGTPEHLRNDVWFSEDGKNWTLATADAGWAPMPRQARDGWIEYPWLDAAFGGPFLSGRELSQLAEYLAFITRTRTTGGCWRTCIRRRG